MTYIGIKMAAFSLWHSQLIMKAINQYLFSNAAISTRCVIDYLPKLQQRLILFGLFSGVRCLRSRYRCCIDRAYWIKKFRKSFRINSSLYGAMCSTTYSTIACINLIAVRSRLNEWNTTFMDHSRTNQMIEKRRSLQNISLSYWVDVYLYILITKVII